MSDANDGEAQPKAPEEEEYSKKKIIIYYSLTVGIVILVVVIALILAIKFDDPMPEGLLLKYVADEDDAKVTLFSSSLKDSISSLTIDDTKLTEITNEYTFKKGEHSVQVELSKDLETMKELFATCTNLVEADFAQINTAKVTSMEGLFKGCSKLTSVTLEDTSSVESMKDMFDSCSSLKSLNLGYFQTSKVTDMSNMFSGTALTSLALTNFDTSNVRDMSFMFYDMKDITSLNLKNFDTSKVTKMDNTFAKCPNLKTLDISKFSSASLVSSKNMFDGIAPNGTVTYNPELFKDDLFADSDAEFWEKKTVATK